MSGFCKILCTYLMDRPRDIKYFHKLRKKNMFNINNKVLKKCLIENCLMLKIISNHWQRCSSVFIIDFIVDILLCCVSGSNTGFEFGRRYKCIRSLEHHKCQKILQTDRSFVFCFMFILDKCALLLKEELYF